MIPGGSNPAPWMIRSPPGQFNNDVSIIDLEARSVRVAVRPIHDSADVR
jgi:hypothetical protein